MIPFARDCQQLWQWSTCGGAWKELRSFSAMSLNSQRRFGAMNFAARLAATRIPGEFDAGARMLRRVFWLIFEFRDGSS